MNQRVSLAPYLVLALSFFGLAVTGYLSVHVYNNTSPGCVLLTGCDTVLESAYSKFFGVPLAYIGLVYYAYLLALGFLLALEPDSKALRLGALLYAGVGLLFSIGFESLQAFVIHALCLYCALSALTTLAFFGVALWHFRSPRAGVV